MARKRKKRGKVGPGGKPRGVDLDSVLSEKVAEGITQGPHALEEANEKFPILPGAVDLSYMRRDHDGELRFRVRENPNNQVALRFPDGRMFSEPDILYPPEIRQEIEQGYRCLRCQEKQSTINADEHLLNGDGCIGVQQYGLRYMRDGFHLIDVAAEFTEDGAHVGPSRPLTQYMEDQDQRIEKLRWVKEQVEKGNGDAALREFRKLYPNGIEGGSMETTTAGKGRLA